MHAAASHPHQWRRRRPSIAIMMVATGSLVLGSMGAATAAKSYRPDGLIRATSDTTWLGNGVYNTTGQQQTRTVKVRQGRMVEFEIKAQNDGAADSFKVRGAAGNGSFLTTYWSNGDNVTSKVVSGTFKLKGIRAGGSRTLVARVHVAPSAPIGSTRTVGVTLTSVKKPAKKDRVEGQITVRSKSVIDTYLASLPAWSDFSPPVDPKNEKTGESDGVLTENGHRYYCHTDTYSFADTPTKLVTFTPDSNVLWLGALLQGKGYTQGIGSLGELPIRQRAPLVLSTNLLTEDTTRTVQKPTVASVQQATGQLISLAADRGLPVASSVSFKQEDMHSLSQATLSLGVSAKYLGAEVKNQLDYNRTLEQHSVAAYFVENAFTVSMVLPQTPGALFSDDFTQGLLDQQIALGRIGPDNLPVFVDSITYGRVLMFSMTSTASSTDIKNTLNAVYNGGKFGASADLTVEQQELLENSEIRVATIGGDSADALELIRSGELGSYFAGGTPSLTSFRPISYTIRNLGDSTLAKVADTLTYNVRTCERQPLAWDVTVTFRKASVGDVDDEWGANSWDMRSFRWYVQGVNHLAAGDAGTAAGVLENTCDSVPLAGYAGGQCMFWANPDLVVAHSMWEPVAGQNGDWRVKLRFDNTGVYGEWPYSSLKIHVGLEDWDQFDDNDFAWGDSVVFRGDDMINTDPNHAVLTASGGSANWTIYATVTKTPVD